MNLEEIMAGALFMAAGLFGLVRPAIVARLTGWAARVEKDPDWIPILQACSGLLAVIGLIIARKGLYFAPEG